MSERIHYAGLPPTNIPICGIIGPTPTEDWRAVTCERCRTEQRRRIQVAYNADPDGDIEGADYV